MDLSRTVACTALLLVVVLSAGHALAQKPAKRSAGKQAQACTIKPVMTDAEIQTCRIASRRR